MTDRIICKLSVFCFTVLSLPKTFILVKRMFVEKRSFKITQMFLINNKLQDRVLPINVSSFESSRKQFPNGENPIEWLELNRSSMPIGHRHLSEYTCNLICMLYKRSLMQSSRSNKICLQKYYHRIIP